MFKLKIAATTIVLMAFLTGIGFSQTLTYPSAIINAVENEPFTDVKPTVLGGSFSSFSISPALPTGLTFSTSDGKISGRPSVVSNNKYTVTGMNVGSNASFVLTINIENAAPLITYPNTGFQFVAGTAITEMVPRNTGGKGNYTVDRPLPKNLELDPATGVIKGIPNEYSPKQLYTIYCSNTTGKSFFQLSIGVDAAAPSISYSAAVYEFRTGKEITPLKPLNNDTKFSSYTVDKPLPEGLQLNSATGEIFGAPVDAVKSDIYTVTATNIHTNASSSFKLSIAIAPEPEFVKMPSVIKFVGEGGVQQSLATGSKLPANTGIGVIYREYSNKRFKWLHSFETEVSINIASTVDTISSVNDKTTNEVMNKGDFGTSVLLPMNSRQAFAFHFTGYLSGQGGKAGNYRRNLAPRPLYHFISGFKVSVVSSNRNWQLVNNDVDKTSTLVKASLMGVYAGIFYDFITPKEENNYGQNASVTLGAGYSGRWILGNAQQDPNGDLRRKLLDSDRKSFGGLELNLGIRFYNIKAEVRVPFLQRKDNIPGLSGVQPNYFIGFSGGFPIDLTKKAND